MSLADKLKDALSSTPCFTSGDRVVVADDGSYHLECQLLALEPLACALRACRCAATSFRRFPAMG